MALKTSWSRPALLPVLLLVIASAWSACTSCQNKKKDQAQQSAGKQSSIDKGQLCAGGGATFDETSGECVCPKAQRWDGSRCEASAESTPTPAADETAQLADTRQQDCEDQGGTWDAAKSHCETVANAGIYDLSKVKAACAKARGFWQADEAYCFCKAGRVLIGDRCLSLKAQLTEEVCKTATYPGHWKKGACLCGTPKDAKVDPKSHWIFSPDRGGCVAVTRPTTASATTLRRICEGSLNAGKWDSHNDRCVCPAGRIWNDEVCMLQTSLSSRQVCRSDFNKGSWDPGPKRCVCASDRIWIDQRCQPMVNVSDQAACVAELNRGRWAATQNTCICPGLKKWTAARKACE